MATRVELVYGLSGTGKTTWMARIARWIWENHRKQTRWYLGDGGGETLISLGVEEFVDIIRYPRWDHPLETAVRVCEGWRPADPLDPRSPWNPPSAEDLAHIGCWVIEGLNSISDYMMGMKPGGLAHRSSEGKMLNNDPAFKLDDGKLSFGGNSRSHYGFTQRRILDLVERSGGLPGYVGWTAHERFDEDEDRREKLIGPAVAGAALTGIIGKSFGNTIHLVHAAKILRERDRTTGRDVDRRTVEFRAYTRTHFDPEGQHFTKYYANNRGHDLEQYVA